MKVGIFGGTFNPPHIGHVTSAETASIELGLNELIVIPAGNPPHKKMPSGTPPEEARFEMARLAFDGVRAANVSDMETDYRVSGYTADTVERIALDFPGWEIFLLVGTDMYLSLESWKDAEYLIRKVTPVVFSRDPADRAGIKEYSQVLNKKYDAQTVIIDNKIIDVSSSQLRGMLQEREGLGYIPDTTYSYIIKYRLYGAKPDWDWLRGKAYSMLDPKRIQHVAGCEAEAVRLAERWGVDADDAREAAILHDVTKRLSVEENLDIIYENQGGSYTVVPGEEKLLHSKTGAILAKVEFGVSEAVADAINWHTTGRARMTVLEKVIYLADYIEPARDFTGVEDLRKLAYKDLDGAMIMGLDLSVEDMRERGVVPNSITFDALNDLRGAPI